ncbi:MAG TPA: prohibitin family protein [Anaerolineales bacterium]|jgi:regulator of protease activity HflC (stomatin/prohibitin superfamily)|nr:prohibitin family protein [Anaerolineales bacterium]HRK90738.1 prohibitin family protein [Anaerolineales bacterium]
MNISSLLQGIASFAWIGFIGILVAMSVRASRKESVKGLRTAAVVLLIAAAVLTSVGAGIVFVEPDELAVVVTVLGQGGIRPDPLESGLHWIIPFAERVERFPKLNQTYTMSSALDEGITEGDDSIQVRTKDGQQVFIDASVIYAVDPVKVVSLYGTWRSNYEDGLVRPQARGVIRDVASQYGVEEIVSSKRAEMEQLISEELMQVFAENNLIMRDFVLRNIRFSDEYAAAVEQKQIAEQQAQQAAFVVEQKKQEAEQARQIAQGQADAAVIAAQGAAEARLIQARAEAEANRLLAESLTPELIQYQYILNLAPGVETIFIPSDQQFILPLPGSSNNTLP